MSGRRIDTKVYRVTIQSLKNHSCHNIQAVGIPSLSDENSFVESEELVKWFGLSKCDMRRGAGDTDLLVGIDQAKLHTGETREAANLVARHFASFGALSQWECLSSHVLVNPTS